MSLGDVDVFGALGDIGALSALSDARVLGARYIGDMGVLRRCRCPWCHR